MGLRRLLWSVFPPSEVVATCQCIREFLAGASVFTPPELEHLALRAAKDAEKTIYSVRGEHITPDHLALILVTNAVARLIPSGAYHSYRGVLNGAGQSMLETWDRAIATLTSKGRYTNVQASEDRAWIRAQIKCGG